MSHRTIVICDGCGKEDPPASAEVWIRTGRTMDPSGNGYQDEGETLHLCAPCCQWVIRRLLREEADNDNAALLANIKARRRLASPGM